MHYMRVLRGFLTVLALTVSAASAFGGSTPDGRFVWAEMNGTLVVQSTGNSWKKILPEANSPSIAADGKKLIYRLGDALFILTLGTDNQISISNVKSFEHPQGKAARWLIYQPGGIGRGWLLRDMITGIEHRFQSVISYSFAGDGTALLLTTTEGQGDHQATYVKWISLPDCRSRVIWSEENLQSPKLVWSADGRQVAFTTLQKTAARTVATIWHYRAGSEKAEILVKDGAPGIEKGFVVGPGPVSFSPQGTKLFFGLQEEPLPKKDSKLTQVTIWSYLDPQVQSQQLRNLALAPRQFVAAVTIADRHITRLGQPNEVVQAIILPNLFSDGAQVTDDFVLAWHFDGDVLMYSNHMDGTRQEIESYSMNDWNWNNATRCSIYLISTRDGSRKLLRAHIKPVGRFFPYYRFSPKGRYVLYYDTDLESYWSYEISSAKAINLTSHTATKWYQGDPNFYVSEFHNLVGLQGWIEGDDEAALVGDQSGDIWRFDLTGRRTPINLTHGFAYRNGLHFSAFGARIGDGSGPPIFSEESEVLIEAITDHDGLANEGIYGMGVKRSADPRALIEVGSPYQWEFVEYPLLVGAPLYVLSRRSGMEQRSFFDMGRRSFFYTRDFRTFTPITDGKSVADKENGEIREERLRWTALDGHPLQGDLFKPADFDPAKKYSAVFTYYEKTPLIGMDEDLVKALLKDGYVVFTPDIHYAIGKTGESVYNAVVSAAKYAAQLPFIDGARMGIMGTSFGGYETAYLVTHSNIFAAAVEQCGATDFFSLYGAEERDEDGFSYMATIENGQMRLGGTPWEQPEVYIRNSPIFSADKVTAPVLILHSSDDNRVPFAQGMEFFMALRRLGKPAWLLDYKTGHGGGSRGPDSRIRTKQFFDHYLKGLPAPRWMTRGIPARLQGVDSGLELDMEIKTPDPRGLLMQ